MSRTVGALALCAALAPPAAAEQLAIVDIADLSLEQLRELQVTSVSRRSQPLLDSAASVYVIPGDAIRRSGVMRLPEALRLAPTLEVAALDARQYAITARGFNTNIANKLLVLVDGRTIYSPLFSGTFWDAHDFVPADIDRIEVITGPAGATWGTNAVNGVINVITRPAEQSLGPSVAVGAGTLGEKLIARYGLAAAPGVAVRLHASAFHREATHLRSGDDAGDATDGRTLGLRADWFGGTDAGMVEAGVFHSRTGERPTYGRVRHSDVHVLGRWSRRLSDRTDVDVQAYLDRTDRKDMYLLQERSDLLDLEVKLRHDAGAHRWLFGAGHRRVHDTAEPGLLFAFLPPQQRLHWSSAFVQDEMAVGERWTLTLGTRVERNPYTGVEHLPSVRVAYKASDHDLVWAALSRAVRSPARLDREIYTPPRPPFIVAGGPNFVSEVADVAELGLRGQRGSALTWSLTGFVQDFDRLRSAQVVGGSVLIANGIAGQIRGVEAWAEWSPRADWRLTAGLLWQEHRLGLKPGSNDPIGPSNLGNDPRLQWSLQSVHTFAPNLDLRLSVRHVGDLPRPAVPAYTALDGTLNWRLAGGVQLTAGVRNLLDRRHLEYDSGLFTGEIPRSGFVTLTYQP